MLKDLQIQGQHKVLPPITSTEIVQPDNDDEDVRIGIRHQTITQRQKTSYFPSREPEKEMTPKERMMLNKLIKADEEGAKIRYKN